MLPRGSRDDADDVKGGTVSIREIEQLRRIEHVVRLGHVVRIEPDEIVLEHGSIPTSPDRLHVHCAAPGLSDNPPRPIYSDDEITLQLVTRLGLTLSGALRVTSSRPAERRRRRTRLPADDDAAHAVRLPAVILAGITTELGWQEAPDLAAWLDACRLNLLHGLGEHDDPAEVRDLQGHSPPRSRRAREARQVRGCRNASRRAPACSRRWGGARERDRRDRRGQRDGRGSVDRLLGRADQIVAVDLTAPDLEGAVGVACDVSDPAAVDRLVADVRGRERSVGSSTPPASRPRWATSAGCSRSTSSGRSSCSRPSSRWSSRDRRRCASRPARRTRSR